MPEFVRADGLLEFDDLVDQLGGNADALLRAAGLDPQETRMSGRYLPHKAFSLALEEAARTLGIPDFGMRLARRQTIHVIGPMALALENAETLDEMLLLAERYIRTHDQALSLSHRFVSQTNEYLWTFRLRVRGAKSLAQNCELVATLACDTMSSLTGGAWRPTEVWFAHAPPGEPSLHAQYFSCPVTFNRDICGIVMQAEGLRTPINGRNVAIAGLARSYLLGRFGDGRPSLAREVECLIRPLLSTGRCNQEYVAGLFAVHSRTLHRRLRLEGTSFEAIVDNQRRMWAAELLTQGVTIGYISDLLGYEYASAFSRSCTRWFGRSPRAYARTRKIGEQHPLSGVLQI
ncbi:AraC family transcriptional regulator [Paraburkholderia sp. J76]|uniref:AraC family transcriptional regulator n=1 Tax=Paraburkholderia sp. J76 TaxID=2805439 RepID=UPI002ABE02C7|nr:AraC family transcriptional regulator ligand-binding domain-containing protein [Paraburkholderia sp. J76]